MLMYFFYKFVFKKINCSNVFALSLFLFLDASSPALENTRSHGTDEAGVQRNIRARWKRLGYVVLRLSHYCNGSCVLGMLPSARYLWTSMIESAMMLLVCLPTSSSRCCHKSKKKKQICILVFGN